MSSSALVTQNPMLRNFENLWFLVQYDKSPTMCVRKIIRSSDFVSSQPVRVGNPKAVNYFKIRENGVQYMALLLFCSENEKDVLVENLLLKFACIFQSNWQINSNVAVDDPQLKKNLYLVAYCPAPNLKGKEVIFGIFNHEKVRLERDQRYLEVTNIFVQDQQIMFKAFLIKYDFTLGNLVEYLKHIRKMRPSEFGFEDLSIHIAHGIAQRICHRTCHRTGGHCCKRTFIEWCVQCDAVRRVGLMNFQHFSEALLEQNK